MHSERVLRALIRVQCCGASGAAATVPRTTLPIDSSSSSSSSSNNATSSSSSPSPPQQAVFIKAARTDSPVPAPYPTDGGHVPIYSVFHGRIMKRMWNYKNESWCELCKEPVGMWVNHIGRKDHALLDQHYTACVEFSRRWNPEELLAGVMDELGVEVAAYQKQYGVYDGERRNELYAMVVKLEEAGMLYFGEGRHTFLHRMQGSFRGMDIQGALVLHQWMLGPFLRLYPEAHIQDYSNLLDFISCSYNLETVYDLCGFYTLDRVALRENYGPSSPAAVGLGGLASSSSMDTQFSGSISTSDNSSSSSPPGASTAGAGVPAVYGKRQEDIEEEAFSRKAVFVRQLLGQLRWLTLPDQRHPAGCTFPPHVVMLGEICVRSLIAETISARLCEYMVRVEPVWRACGFERKQLPVFGPDNARWPRDVLPAPIKYAYKSMSPRMDDLYSVCPGTLEGEVMERLRSKGVALPGDDAS